MSRLFLSVISAFLVFFGQAESTFAQHNHCQKLLEASKEAQLKAWILSSELPVDFVQRMQADAQEVLLVGDLLQDGSSAGTPALGIATNEYNQFVHLTKLQSWKTVYASFGFKFYSGPSTTHEIMSGLVEYEESIIIFVPNQALTHSQAGVTKEEIEWIMAHPEHLHKFIFVFGLYKQQELRPAKLRSNRQAS